LKQSSSPGEFPTTQWSRVARAGDPDAPGSREALEGLCRDYWYPLYAYLRRSGHGPETAGDLVQSFFTELIERGGLATADRDRGRFRSYLRAACDHHVAHARERDRAKKRGGGRRIFSIDLFDAEGRYGREPAHELTAERLFRRRWALDLLNRVLLRLEDEAIQGGRAELFVRLRPMLEGDHRAAPYRDVGAALGLTEGAVKVAAHRMRARYRELLRDEVARTVRDPADIDGELADLIAALSG
jgi:DNA-directed RNA polymerase specialized sigma24 family protein